MALGQNRRPSRDTEARNGKRDMRGKLWPNQRKQNAKSPDYTGVATVDGRDYRVSLWEGDRDETLTIAFREKTEARRQSYERSRENQAPTRSEYDDDRNPPPADEWDH